MAVLKVGRYSISSLAVYRLWLAQKILSRLLAFSSKKDDERTFSPQHISAFNKQNWAKLVGKRTESQSLASVKKTKYGQI
jgi:hypothetical protein